MDPTLLNALGAAASTVSLVMFFPQAIKTWTHRHDPITLEGVSVQAQFLILANASLWALYGIGSGAVWAAVPSFVNFPLAVFVLALLLRARNARIHQMEPTEPEGTPMTPDTSPDSTPAAMLCGKFIAPAGAPCVLDALHRPVCSTIRPETAAAA